LQSSNPSELEAIALRKLEDPMPATKRKATRKVAARRGEQGRLVRLLVERVDVSEDGIRVRLKTEELRNVIQDLQDPPAVGQAA
jgi:hypothetical protein